MRKGRRPTSLRNKLTRGEALYAYTQGSAYAEFAEKAKGKLAPGYDADFILIDRDLYKTRRRRFFTRTFAKAGLPASRNT